jgi:hypothetical protein
MHRGVPCDKVTGDLFPSRLCHNQTGKGPHLLQFVKYCFPAHKIRDLPYSLSQNDLF